MIYFTKIQKKRCTKVKIPLVDLKAQYFSIKKDIDAAINRCVQHTQFIGGPPVLEFEKEFAQLCDTKFAVGLSSGTSALYLALKAYGIGKGDEVIIPTLTFIATAEAVTATGAKPVFVDIDEKTYTISSEKINAAFTKKTKAVIPVHLYGQPANMDTICKIAKEKNLLVIEDACQSHCAEYNNKRIPYSDIACFSFFPGKNLGAYGDAGAVVTNNEVITDTIKLLRDHGRKSGQKYESAVEGFSHRMDSLQAAILTAKIKHIEKWTEQRIQNSKIYEKLLPEQDIILPYNSPKSRHVYHLYAVRVKKRDQLKQFLMNKGITTGIHYPIPLHAQPAYNWLKYKKDDFPASNRICSEILSLPMYPELTENQIEFIAKQIKNFQAIQ